MARSTNIVASSSECRSVVSNGDITLRHDATPRGPARLSSAPVADARINIATIELTENLLDAPRGRSKGTIANIKSSH